jgi:hypothetical protein
MTHLRNTWPTAGAFNRVIPHLIQTSAFVSELLLGPPTNCFGRFSGEGICAMGVLTLTTSFTPLASPKYHPHTPSFSSGSIRGGAVPRGCFSHREGSTKEKIKLIGCCPAAVLWRPLAPLCIARVCRAPSPTLARAPRATALGRWRDARLLQFASDTTCVGGAQCWMGPKKRQSGGL